MKTIATAWVDDPCKGTNPACREANREGRRVHIIPRFDDPRAAEFTIALPTYHFATELEGLLTLEAAWQRAEIAYTADERDALYARGVAVKIANGVCRP